MEKVQTRIARLMGVLNWNQPAMGRYLGITQPSVCRLVNGRSESGPISRLLDRLEEQLKSEGLLSVDKHCLSHVDDLQSDIDDIAEEEQVKDRSNLKIAFNKYF
jgi:transcriptional regulator with XRE-family HTH domain